MPTERDIKTKIRLEKEKAKQEREQKRGDEILENMLNTPPETHEEMKEKKKK